MSARVLKYRESRPLCCPICCRESSTRAQSLEHPQARNIFKELKRFFVHDLVCKTCGVNFSRHKFSTFLEGYFSSKTLRTHESYGAPLFFTQSTGNDIFIPHLPARQSRKSVVHVAEKKIEVDAPKNLLVLEINNQTLGIQFHFSLHAANALPKLAERLKNAARSLQSGVKAFLEIEPRAVGQSISGADPISSEPSPTR